VESPAKEKPAAESPYLSHAIAGAIRHASENHLLTLVRLAPVPRHLAIIMDGNRRFASDHGMLIHEGHEAGKEKLEELLDWCLEVGIRILTVYALSTENFHRSGKELEALMDLFARSFRQVVTDKRVHEHHIRVQAIGNVAVLPQYLRDAIAAAEEATQSYSDYYYNVAIAYGGREEIVEAIRKLARRVADGTLRPEEIDSQKVSGELYTAHLPDPDLVFRTSGEERISNFLLWQTAYAELYFSDVNWPGLTKLDFLRAIRAFQNRQRRYGA
jgi:tritrans,polycis-undecaprenyl-diphosphate synthase [geranylgeranyl-diphosphate specific]